MFFNFQEVEMGKIIRIEMYLGEIHRKEYF